MAEKNKFSKKLKLIGLIALASVSMGTSLKAYSNIKQAEINSAQKQTTSNKLQAPVCKLTVGYNIVTWNDIQNAKEYEVYLDGKLVGKTPYAYYAVSEYGNHSIQVKAMADEYKSSDLSKEFEFKIYNYSDKKDITELYNLNNEIILNYIEKETGNKFSAQEVLFYDLGDSDIKIYTKTQLGYDAYKVSLNERLPAGSYSILDHSSLLNNATVEVEHYNTNNITDNQIFNKILLSENLSGSINSIVNEDYTFKSLLSSIKTNADGSYTIQGVIEYGLYKFYEAECNFTLPEGKTLIDLEECLENNTLTPVVSLKQSFSQYSKLFMRDYLFEIPGYPFHNQVQEQTN